MPHRASVFSPVSLGMGKIIEFPSRVFGEGQLYAKHSGLVTGTQSTRRKLLVLMNIILKQMLAILSFPFFWKLTHASVVFIARLAFISTLLVLALPPAPHPCPRPAHGLLPGPWFPPSTAPPACQLLCIPDLYVIYQYGKQRLLLENYCQRGFLLASIH